MGDAVFDRLVADLSLGERQQLLERLSSSAAPDSGPLICEKDLGETFDAAALLQSKPWYVRFYYRIVALFTSRTVPEVFEHSLFVHLAQDVERGAPGFFDFQRGLLLSPFRTELAALRDSARFFHDALEGSLVRDKAAFIVFLGSLNMDWIHRRILEEADPFAVGAVNSSLNEQDIRQLSSRSLETILQGIGEDERSIMYQDIRTLSCLRELSTFLFDRLLSSFQDGPDGSVQLALVADQLAVLSNILYSLQRPPSLPVLESLFVFSHQDELKREGFKLEGELSLWLGRARAALDSIRSFNRSFQLPSIVRLATKKLAWSPHAVSAGEDWFLLYREFWRKEIDNKFQAFVSLRRREELETAINALFKARTRPLLLHAASTNAQVGLPVKYGASLSFLMAFHQFVFMGELNRYLKPILVDGEFRKRDNRAEFTESYNDLVSLMQRIKDIDDRLAPNGEWGALYAMAQSELVALPVKRRKIQTILSEADTRSSDIINTAFKALRSLAALVQAIIGKSPSPKYDGITNFDQIAPKGVGYIDGLGVALQSLEKTLQILSEIEALDSGR